MGRFVAPASRTGVVMVPETVFQTRRLSTLRVVGAAPVQTWTCPLKGEGGGLESVTASLSRLPHQTWK